MTTPRIYKTEAIVLRQRKLGEAGKIVTLYTPNYGKLDAVAKGVRRPKSRLAGHLEVLTHTAVMLAQGRNLDTVTQAQTVESFAPLRADLHRLSRALYAAELVDRFSPEGAEGYHVFQLLLATLRRLVSAKNVDTVLRHLEMQLLSLSGFQPQLGRCVNCERILAAAPSYFSPDAGGVLCPSGRASRRKQNRNAQECLHGPLLPPTTPPLLRRPFIAAPLLNSMPAGSSP